MEDYENNTREWDGGYINTVYSRDEFGRLVQVGFSSQYPWAELHDKQAGYIFTCAKRERREVFGRKATHMSSADNIAEFLIAMDMVPDDMDTIICINRTHSSLNEDFQALPDEAPQPGKSNARILYDDGYADFGAVEPIIARGSISNIDFQQQAGRWASFFDQKTSEPSWSWATFNDTAVYSECNNYEQGLRVAQIILSDAIVGCGDLFKLNMVGNILRDNRAFPETELAIEAINVLGRGRISCEADDILALSRRMRNSVFHLLPLARKWAPDVVQKAELLRGLCHIWEEGNRRYHIMSGRTLFYDRHGKTTLNGLTQRINRDGFVDIAIDAICDGVPLEDVLA